MKITTLIQELQKLLEEHWDIECVVQHRDYGWNYHWTEDPYLYLKDNTIIL